METLSPSKWIAQCAQRLQERWLTVAPEVLEEVAVDIWKDAQFRDMPPVEAAIAWLAPIAGPSDSN